MMAKSAMFNIMYSVGLLIVKMEAATKEDFCMRWRYLMVNQQADLEVVRKVPIPSSSATMFLHSSLCATWTNPDSRTVSLDLPGLLKHFLDALLLKENDATPKRIAYGPI